MNCNPAERCYFTVRGSHTNGVGLFILFQTASKNGGPLFKHITPLKLYEIGIGWAWGWEWDANRMGIGMGMQMGCKWDEDGNGNRDGKLGMVIGIEMGMRIGIGGISWDVIYLLFPPLF